MGWEKCKNTLRRKICLQFPKMSLKDALPCKLTWSLEMNQQPPCTLQALFEAACTPTGVWRMLRMSAEMAWSSIRANEDSSLALANWPKSVQRDSDSKWLFKKGHLEKSILYLRPFNYPLSATILSFYTYFTQALLRIKVLKPEAEQSREGWKGARLWFLPRILVQTHWLCQRWPLLPWLLCVDASNSFKWT